MIEKQIIKYVAIGTGVLLALAVVLWQANKLVKMGRELGEAKAVEEKLRGELKDSRDARAKEVRELKVELLTCTDQVKDIAAASAEWQAKWEAIRRRPPREVTVEIESETWHDSLVEGHSKLLSGLERIRDEDTPFPPG